MKQITQWCVLFPALVFLAFVLVKCEAKAFEVGDSITLKRNHFIMVSEAPTTILTIQEKMREYLDWIANQSGKYEQGVPFPKVSYISKEMLKLMIYGAEKITEADEEGYKLIEILAAYKNGEVFFPNEFDHNDPMYQHTLFHEMVHHHQYLVYGKSTCAGLREVEAYELQKQWQNEVNSPAKRPNMLVSKIQEMLCKRGR